MSDFITIHMPRESAYLCHAAISNRLDEIARYHENYPDLPRQDDVADIYKAALVALTKAGVKA